MDKIGEGLDIGGGNVGVPCQWCGSIKCSLNENYDMIICNECKCFQ